MDQDDGRTASGLDEMNFQIIYGQVFAQSDVSMMMHFPARLFPEMFVTILAVSAAASRSG